MPGLGVKEANTGYNWHPAVHTEHFGESLYFFMVRLREPRHEPVADQVRELMQAAGIQFACEYALFGWWDALIRVWLTQAAYSRLLRILAPSSRNNIADFRGFATSQIRYLWTGSDEDLLSHDVDTLTAITAKTGHIDHTAQNPTHSDQEIWDSLEGKGLVFPRPSDRIDSVKFYTTLERTHDKMSISEEVESVLAALNAAGMAPNASLYLGAGPLSDYLVRCVADSYREVLELVASFDINLKDARLRPMTLLIANTDSRESDHVNEPIQLGLMENNDLDLLELSDPGSLGRLTTPERLNLHKLVVRACELPGNDQMLREKLLEILRSVVLSSHTDFQESLAFMLDFEFHLRERLAREWTAVLGSDWLSILRGWCEEHEEWDQYADEIAQKVDKWSLGALHFAARVSAERSPQCQARIVRQLGDDWKKQVPALRLLRNDVAHGRLHKLKRPYEFNDRLVKFLNEALDAAVLWRRCMGDEETA